MNTVDPLVESVTGTRYRLRTHPVLSVVAATVVDDQAKHRGTSEMPNIAKEVADLLGQLQAAYAAVRGRAFTEDP